MLTFMLIVNLVVALMALTMMAGGPHHGLGLGVLAIISIIAANIMAALIAGVL